MTFPLLSQQELVKSFADDFPVLKLRDDDFTNPQVLLTAIIFLFDDFVQADM